MKFPTKIWIFKFFLLMVFAIKMLLDNAYGLPNLFEFKRIISIVSFKQNMNLKIQILAGNTLMSRFHVGFEIELPLVLLLTPLCDRIWNIVNQSPQVSSKLAGNFWQEGLKAIQFQNRHEILTSMYFPPKFEFLNYVFSSYLPSKCF